MSAGIGSAIHLVLASFYLKTPKLGVFPGGPVVKTLRSHCRDHRFDPWSRKFHVPRGPAKQTNKQTNKKPKNQARNLLPFISEVPFL